MTERERLKEMICKVTCDGEESFLNCPERRDDKCRSIQKLEMCQINTLADYLLANGVIVPPVSVGQTVWFIRNLGDKSREKIIETSIEKIVMKKTGLHIKLACNAMYETSCNSIGKTVFLTKEEAEKALERSRG